jgi:hypothetical protein
VTTADGGDAPGLGALARHAEPRKALPDPERVVGAVAVAELHGQRDLGAEGDGDWSDE